MCKDMESICIVYLLDERRKTVFVVFQLKGERVFDSIRHVLLFTFHSGLFFALFLYLFSVFRFSVNFFFVQFFSIEINR